MCKLQCLVTLLALFAGVESWDIAMTSGDHLEFYTNKTNVHNASTPYTTNVTALAYDAVHNMLLFVDRQNDNASIFGYHIATKKFQALVRKRSSESIHGVAFDPVNSLLFWTDTLTRSIYSMSLKQGSEDSAYGKLVLQLNDEIPRGIAIDSCRGFVYWSNVNIKSKSTIERARFDGTQREVVASSGIYMPVSLAIDQRTRRLYWADDKEGIYFSIDSFDLDGKLDEPKKVYDGADHRPATLTVSKDSLYWLDWDHKRVWKLPKNANKHTDPKTYISFENDNPFSIVANYLIEDQTEGIAECKELRNLSQNKPVASESLITPPDTGLFCLHGVKANNKEECKCTPGYTGRRCDVSVCHNYCFQGDCSVTSDGLPSCRCKEGFSGDRCEVNVCTGFCLNYGACSLNEEHKPVCSCTTDFTGSRCEAEKPRPTTPAERTVETTVKTILETDTSKICNCTSNVTTPLIYSEHSTDEFILPTSCNDSWDAIRDPVIMVLGILCGLLVLACVVLFTKVLQLTKRPRIKKRFIVNKNVTPMTARPDQCEITIENCCNMNICETPCFEPRSTIRPTLLDSKPGKEEKKNLISNMEYPDDY